MDVCSIFVLHKKDNNDVKVSLLYNMIIIRVLLMHAK